MQKLLFTHFFLGFSSFVKFFATLSIFSNFLNEFWSKYHCPVKIFYWYLKKCFEKKPKNSRTNENKLQIIILTLKRKKILGDWESYEIDKCSYKSNKTEKPLTILYCGFQLILRRFFSVVLVPADKKKLMHARNLSHAASSSSFNCFFSSIYCYYQEKNMNVKP